MRGDSAFAAVDTGPPGLAATGSRTVLALPSLQREYGVRIQLGVPGDTLIAYDGRGLTNPRLNRIARYVLVGRWTRDSICVTSLGTILPRTCTL